MAEPVANPQTIRAGLITRLRDCVAEIELLTKDVRSITNSLNVVVDDYNAALEEVGRLRETLVDRLPDGPAKDAWMNLERFELEEVQEMEPAPHAKEFIDVLEVLPIPDEVKS